MISCIGFGLSRSTLVSPISDDQKPDNPTLFSKNATVTANGSFYGYSLLMDFGEDQLDSSGKKIINLLENLTLKDALKNYDSDCKRQIIKLIALRDKSQHYNDMLVFCQHTDCIHQDGFMYNTEIATLVDSLRTDARCPSSHAFCVTCLQVEHTGFCTNTSEQQRELLLIPGHKVCPTCKIVIFKDTGCNHMTCAHCGQNYCWLCDKKFSRSEQYLAHGCSQF